MSICTHYGEFTSEYMSHNFIFIDRSSDFRTKTLYVLGIYVYTISSTKTAGLISLQENDRIRKFIFDEQ